MRTVPLGELIKISKGKKPDVLLDSPSENTRPCILIDEVRGKVPSKFTLDAKGTEVFPSDICIVWDGANAGTIGTGISGLVGSTIARIRLIDSNKWNNDFIACLLKAKFQEINKKAQGRGATIPHVDKNHLETIKIPLYNYTEQKRIAAILDQADSLRRARRQAIEKLNTLAQSIFYEMFGDPSVNTYGFPVGTIRDLVREVKYGTSKKAHTEQEGFPMLRMGNLTYSGELDVTDLKYVHLEGSEIEKYTARKGDILFNRTNSKELVGKTAVFDESQPYAIAGYLVRARTNKKANPYYISSYLNSAHGKKILFNMCKNIVGMANINAQELQDIKIIIPPIELQNQYSERLHLIRGHKMAHQKALSGLETLFFSLQHRAFRGEL